MVAEHTTDLVCTDDPAWISATGCELDGTSPLRVLQRTLTLGLSAEAWRRHPCFP